MERQLKSLDQEGDFGGIEDSEFLVSVEAAIATVSFDVEFQGVFICGTHQTLNVIFVISYLNLIKREVNPVIIQGPPFDTKWFEMSTMELVVKSSRGHPKESLAVNDSHFALHSDSNEAGAGEPHETSGLHR